MNALEKLHPRFYPRPTRQILHEGKPVAVEDIKDGFLTKEELLRSYRATGNFLHVGGITEFFAKRQKEPDGTVGSWVKRLIVLLNHHSIYLADEPNAWAGQEPLRFPDGELAPKRQVIVQMQVGPHNRPAATLFESVGPAPKQWPSAPG
jgi:hypothetical protein